MSHKAIKTVARFLVVLMILWSLPPKIEAEFVSSEMIKASLTDRESDLAHIQKIIEAKMIKSRLEQLGFTEEEIHARFSKLNDQDLHQLALQLEDLKTGGDGLGLIIALLVIAILVVVLFKITGHKIKVVKED